MSKDLLSMHQLDGPPIVGKRYLVPCVFSRWVMRYDWWPVLGPPHQEDLPEDTLWDWHLDPRFLTEDQEHFAGGVEAWCNFPTDRFPGRAHPGRWIGTRASRQFTMIWAGSGGRCGPRRLGEVPPVPGDPPPAELRALVCRRPTTAPEPLAWPFPALAKYGDPAEPIRAAGGRLLCPHRKFDLTHEPPDGDGIVICPLHRLKVKCV